MEVLFESVDFWHWWVAAIIFVVLEVFSPAAFFLWLGFSAGIVGVFVFIQPDMTWEWQIGLFAIFSVVSTVFGRRFFANNQVESDHPQLNRRGEQYIDRVFTLTEAIENGVGKISVDDTTWKVSGEDAAVGQKVQVTGIDGTVLTVITQ